MTIPLLFLTFGLLLPNGVEASTGLFSPGLTASDVIAEVNALRDAYGLPPYQVDTTLMTIAQSHAEYMASSGVVTHYGADGSRPYQRAIEAGYSVAGDLSLGGFFSENIHSGANLSAADVVEIWQGDSLHLNTMISPDLQDIGVGLAVVNGVNYYVLDAGLSTGEAFDSTPASGGDPFATVTGTPSTTQPVLVSTPDEDGSVYHIVQADQALWSIALAYDTTIEELKLLNRLVNDEIFIGQKLLISKKEIPTSTPVPSLTVTLGIPTSTATRPVTPTLTWTPTPLPTPPASKESGGKVVGLIILSAFLVSGIVAWLSRKRPA